MAVDQSECSLIEACVLEGSQASKREESLMRDGAGSCREYEGVRSISAGINDGAIARIRDGGLSSIYIHCMQAAGGSQTPRVGSDQGMAGFMGKLWIISWYTRTKENVTGLRGTFV